MADSRETAGGSAPERAIPLKAVEDALMCAMVRLKSRTADGRRHGRCAAFTQVPTLEPACRDARWYGRNGGQPRPGLRSHFSPMHAGDLRHLVERVRLERGLQEVRRTWGKGLRAMQAELATGEVMR